MCGIVVYIGKKEVYLILIKGFKWLEYCGYDSVGIVLFNDSDLNLYKCQGKVFNFEDFVDGKDIFGFVGIGYICWVIYGLLNDVNVYLYMNSIGDLVLIYNGIIENYNLFKEELIVCGYYFKSQIDMEVFVYLIDDICKQEGVELVEVVCFVLQLVVGVYVIVVILKDNLY